MFQRTENIGFVTLWLKIATVCAVSPAVCGYICREKKICLYVSRIVKW